MARCGAGLVALALLLAVSGCAEPRAERDAQARARAEQLVDATQAAGVAPDLTVESAAALFGTDAATVCDVFRDGPRAAQLEVLGNAAQRRSKTISDDSITFARLVVETYCPDVRDDFEEAVDQVSPVEVGR